jgi:glycosyltransferase involved in cell wall biosynthesis
VINQTLRDIEVIIVDDGSTEPIAPLLAPFLDHDPRVRVVRQPNRGLAGARNRGIDESRSALVALIDADDVWHPAFLEACVSALRQAPAAPFAFAYVFRVDSQDRVLPSLIHRRAPRHDAVGLITVNSVACGSAAVFRKSEVLAVGGFDVEMASRNLHGAEDWKLLVTLASRAKPVVVERPLVGYRLDAGSMSQRQPSRQLSAIRAVMGDLRAELPDVAPKVFRDGETMMIAWLLPAFARQRDARSFIAEFFKAYIGNPSWVLNPLLRRVHQMRIKLLLQQLLSWGQDISRRKPHLRLLELEGERPFAYLDQRHDVRSL